MNIKQMQLSGIKKVRVALGDPSEPRNMRIIAVLSWRSLICIAIFLALASLFYGFLKFQTTLQTLEEANAQVSAAKTKFNRAEFDAIVAAWSARQLRYHVAEAAAPPIADPSK